MITFFIPARVAFDPSGANAIGSYGHDRIQNIVAHTNGKGYYGASDFVGNGFIGGALRVTNVFNQTFQAGTTFNTKVFAWDFDSSRVVRTDTKTMPEHTHFALRLVSY